MSECLDDNSSAERDLIANGYIAARLENELRCQGARASVLLSTENITDRVVKAIGDVEPAVATAVRNKVLTTLEADCEQASKQAGTPLSCESVTMAKWLASVRSQLITRHGPSQSPCPRVRYGFERRCSRHWNQT